MKQLLIFPLLIFGYLFLNAQALLQSGPMLGYSEMREVALWVQTKESAKVHFSYYDLEKPGHVYQTAPAVTTYQNAFVAELIADSVQPGNRYAYTLFINDEAIELPYKTEFQSQTLWQYRSTPPTFTLATGSCAYINEEQYDRPGSAYGGDYQIFESIYKMHPDLMLWLGDNYYLREPDWNTWTGITHRITHGRSIPELQPLLASTHHYAIWDDHDFGPNNSDRSFWNKNTTLKAFELFWANPSVGLANIPGAITQFQFADIDFFLLDNRYYRAPNDLKGDGKTILGQAQLQWLKDVLVTSNGSFKIIAMGGQFLNTAARFENYSNNGFAEERQEIIDFIYKQNIKNVVFLTGDRHASELSILKDEGKPRIVDLTISPLTSGAATNNENENNTLRVKGTYVKERNYGMLTFTGEYNTRKIVVEVFDAHGEKIWNRELEKE